jgi:hypothetical protein
MKIRGRVAHVGVITTGVSQRTGNKWKSQEVVIEYFDNDNARYPDSVNVRIFGERVDNLQLQVNDEVEASIGLNAREYDGRFYNEARVYRIERVGGSLQQPAAPAPASGEEPAHDDVSPVIKPSSEASKGDDLPF